MNKPSMGQKRTVIKNKREKIQMKNHKSFLAGMLTMILITCLNINKTAPSQGAA